MKIVSLLPAATEMVALLGLQDSLVGISHECDFPESIINKEVCTFSNINSSMTSVEIDHQVKTKIQHSLSLYEVDFQKLQQLAPDVIITQDQCEVCAVAEKDLHAFLKQELPKPPQVISFHPNSLTDIIENFAQLAQVLGVSNLAQQIISGWQERIELIHHKLKFVKEKPTVTFIEWLEPLMNAGNWTPELISRAGGIDVFQTTTSSQKSHYIHLNELINANPEVLVLGPCGFPITKTLSELHVLLSKPEVSALRAIKNNRVYVVDGNSYFNRSGPRIIDSLEMMAEIIGAGSFYFGYEGNGFVKLSV